jgi:hypothetical protein
LTESARGHISSEEIKRRQVFANELNGDIQVIIKNETCLSNIVNLVIWHGSLPLGEGGEKYDIDYAVFMNAHGVRELMEYSKEYLFTMVWICLKLIATGFSMILDFHLLVFTFTKVALSMNF